MIVFEISGLLFSCFGAQQQQKSKMRSMRLVLLNNCSITTTKQMHNHNASDKRATSLTNMYRCLFSICVHLMHFMYRCYVQFIYSHM